jgi:hypothetical protein
VTIVRRGVHNRDRQGKRSPIPKPRGSALTHALCPAKQPSDVSPRGSAVTACRAYGRHCKSNAAHNSHRWLASATGNFEQISAQRKCSGAETSFKSCNTSLAALEKIMHACLFLTVRDCCSSLCHATLTKIILSFAVLSVPVPDSTPPHTNRKSVSSSSLLSSQKSKVAKKCRIPTLADTTRLVVSGTMRTEAAGPSLDRDQAKDRRHT